MNIKTFKNIEQATEYIINTCLKVNQFNEVVRILEEKSVIKINNTYIFIDELELLN
jgi:hypothetical protein